jgi:hypothetical protein
MLETQPVDKDREQLKKIFLLLFDISGYTDFICRHGGRFPHAESITSDLLSTIISSMASDYELYQITGDAVSFYLESEGGPEKAKAIWDRVEEVFTAFRIREKRLREESARTCNHCSVSKPLKLKCVLHYAEVTRTTLHGFTKIAGPDVILAHRLLKNDIRSKEYIIVTSDFYFAGGMMTPMGAVLQGERYDSFGDVGILVWYPPGAMPDGLRPREAGDGESGWN